MNELIHGCANTVLRAQPGTPAAAIQKPKQEEADKRALPSSILSKQQYFEQIFQLLALGGNSAQLVRIPPPNYFVVRYCF